MGLPAAFKRSGLWVAVIMFIAAGVIYYVFGRHGNFHAPNSAYFVDEETGEESIRPISDIPPLMGKNGKETVVREVKYSLDGTVKVAYYFKYDAATKQQFEKAQTAGEDTENIGGVNGELVRSPAPGSKWVSVGSDEGQSISHIDMGDGKNFAMVFP